MSIKKLTFDCTVSIEFTERECRGFTEGGVSLQDIISVFKWLVSEAIRGDDELPRQVIQSIRNIETES